MTRLKQVFILIRFFDDTQNYECIYICGELTRLECFNIQTKYPYLEAIALCFSVLKYPCDVTIVAPEKTIEALREYMQINKYYTDNYYINSSLELHKQIGIHHVSFITHKCLSQLSEKSDAKNK